jgi:hypothetical protein
MEPRVGAEATYVSPATSHVTTLNEGGEGAARTDWVREDVEWKPYGPGEYLHVDELANTRGIHARRAMVRNIEPGEENPGQMEDKYSFWYRDQNHELWSRPDPSWQETWLGRLPNDLVKPLGHYRWRGDNPRKYDRKHGEELTHPRQSQVWFGPKRPWVPGETEEDVDIETVEPRPPSPMRPPAGANPFQRAETVIPREKPGPDPDDVTGARQEWMRYIQNLAEERHRLRTKQQMMWRRQNEGRVADVSRLEREIHEQKELLQTMKHHPPRTRRPNVAKDTGVKWVAPSFKQDS